MDEWGELEADRGEGRLHYPPSMEDSSRAPAGGRAGDGRQRGPPAPPPEWSECGAWRAVHGAGAAILPPPGKARLPPELEQWDPAALAVLGAALDGEVPEGPHGAILSEAASAVRRAVELRGDRGGRFFIGRGAGGRTAVVPESDAREVRPWYAGIGEYGLFDHVPYATYNVMEAAGMIYGCIATGVVEYGHVMFGGEGRHYLQSAVRDCRAAVESSGDPVMLGILARDATATLEPRRSPVWEPAEIAVGRRGRVALAPQSLSRLFLSPAAFTIAGSGIWSASEMHPALQRSCSYKIYDAAGYNARFYGNLSGGRGERGADVELLENSLEGAAAAEAYAPPAAVEMDVRGGVQVRWSDTAGPGAEAERIEVSDASAASRQPKGLDRGGSAASRIEARRRLAAAVRPGMDSVRHPVARIEVRPARMLEGGALLMEGVAGEARRAYEGLVPLLNARRGGTEW